jgi:hypothetical protein
MKTIMSISNAHKKMVQQVENKEAGTEAGRNEHKMAESEDQSCWLLRSLEGMKKALWFSNLQNSN